MSRAAGGGFDLTKMLATEDWFSSISPQIMKRILNVVSLTGRLLRANRLTFTWERLTAWINMTEVWPYRTSWIVLYIEEHDDLDIKIALKTIYQKIVHLIPQSAAQEPLLEIDSADSRQLEVFLSAREPALTVRDVIRFLPCTVNLDPKLREWIIDWQVTRTQAASAQNPLSPLVLNPLSPNLIQMSSAEPSQLISPTTTATVPESIIGRASVFSPVNVPQQAFQFNPPRNSNRFEDMSCNELSNWAGNIPGLTTKGREKIAQYFKKENLSGFVICRMGGNFEIIR